MCPCTENGRLRPHELAIGQVSAARKMRGEADMANERRTKRAYECSREDLKNFVFENSLDFELIHTRLAEQYAVDGPDEEDCVHQMAKCLFLKRTLPTKRTQMEDYNEAEALDGFNDLLLAGASESRIKDKLNDLGGRSGPHLRKKVPRDKFDSVEKWIEALKTEIFSVLMPQVIEARYNQEQLFQNPSGKLSEDILMRDLAYEKLVDELFDLALHPVVQD
jgi:hypothetical protein